MNKLLLVLLSSFALAVSAQGYVTSSDGSIVKSGSNLCWRTGSWTPANATKECDPELVKAPNQVAITQSLAADVLFDFDKSTLTNAGKIALDKVAASIVPGSKVVVVGHADRIGTAQYNLKLSQNRANTVASYLSGKVQAQFVASGVGSTQPVVGTECKEAKGLKNLIACLAPNRRVTIQYVK